MATSGSGTVSIGTNSNISGDHTFDLGTISAGYYLSYFGIYLTKNNPDNHNSNTTNKAMRTYYKNNSSAWFEMRVRVGSGAWQDITPQTAGSTRFTVSGCRATLKVKDTASYISWYCSISYSSATAATTAKTVQLKWSGGGKAYMWGANPAYYWAASAIPVSACTAPTAVTCSRTRGVVTISWQGAGAGTGNSISSYGIIRNTSQSTSGATTVNSAFASTATSGSTTNSPGAGTFYYGVRTQGSAGSSYYSGYKWSAAITVPTRPTVTAGDTITKAQMDSLKSWINTTTPTSVAQGDSITATIGNTYRASSATAGGSVTATWYNTD